MKKQLDCKKCGSDLANYHVFIENDGPFCRICAIEITDKKDKSGTNKPDPRFTT